ncbi:palmitoyltransferase ZDHHC17 isoform X1 [Helianthus annuus]|uniref:palmitoyltransferase ZDHHC17 isoform X1 n=1 Tax=Helianthus annuus TaxID=4232 RepID=UPI001652C38F|nr:palmitoyltransferase ZDHHC17 isoform X1 [Helianthus annuus]
MEYSGRRRKHRDPWRLICRSTVSFVCVCLAQFALFLLSSFFNSSNIITLLFLSVIVLLGLTVIGRRCKRLFGLRGSAPAFVFTNIVFMWCVYLVAIRQAISFPLDILFHAELIILLIGLYRIISGDPGFVDYAPISNTETFLEGSELPISNIYEGSPSVESSLLLQRVRYCKYCHAHVKGFDHHCPAFGNCIGQNNHFLFMILLAGFIIAESCYILSASQITTASRTLDSDGQKQVVWTVALATSTMVFSILQVLWQAAFLAWHIYCVCFNIRTDEWMHWKKYPEFQHITHSQLGETGTTRYRNPYDKGIWQNLKEFIEAKG